MTDLPTLRELLKEVEGLDGPSREVDRSLFAVAGTHVLEKRGRDQKEWWYRIDGKWPIRVREGIWNAGFPKYTASLDAAIGLFEATLPEWRPCIQQTGGGWWVEIWDESDLRLDNSFVNERPTPALALLSAILKAKIAILEAEEEAVA